MMKLFKMWDMISEGFVLCFYSIMFSANVTVVFYAEVPHYKV
jgi:hypothetical protein